MQTIQDQIQQRLSLLPETMLSEVLLFIDFLLSRLKPKPEQSLLELAGTLPAEDAAQIQQALQDCEQINLNEW